ncbi:hypothetical protein SUGI_0793500 [Cryptomeria japonica]|uniref:uncharacterized protein LOC131078559 n=1 Tax=Cryptomeria japonica TaxID=3369 RepID=UPI0024148844|nr:uncharacterized protein LOC131078559 [Cryptomeria japonica]GLJ38925.1 hypothetical protein SUGI_0793500 [Cryptomeria japonica]
MSYWVYNRVEFDFDGDWRNSQVIYNDFDCKWLEERLGIFVPENEKDLKVRANHLEQIVEAAREDMDAQDEYLFFKWSQADEDYVYDLPLIKIEEKLQCLICIEDMEIGEMGKELPCEHIFHDGCIEEWLLDYNHVCPICKFELPVAEIDEN